MFEEFVRAAKAQDERNCFSEYTGDMQDVPSDLHTFYRKYNPEDVEVEYGANIIHFVPVYELEEKKQEYSYLNADIVIATINGDPVFMKGQKVYTCPHGSKWAKIEQLADSFEKFTEMISLSK